MTFLNPFVLFGLIAAAIPVILHLLNLRKLRTIEFSTLSFLKELQQTKIRRLKLRQILLLIVRTLLVILIIFTFARPALRGTLLGSIGTHAHSTIVLILDDSFSMTATDEHGELFKQAKEAAQNVIDLVKDGDEVFLIKLSDVPQATIDPASHDVSALQTVIREAQPSTVRRALDDAIRLSAKLLRQARNANKEVYVISDMQKTLMTGAATLHQQEPASLFDEQTNFFLVYLGTKNAANVSIDSVAIFTSILEKDKPVRLFSSVRNFSSVPITNYVVSVYLDGVRAAQSNVSAEPWGSATTEFNVIPKRTGLIKGYVELENDAIEPDNTHYFSLTIPERINVALVSGSSTDNKFMMLALRAGMNDGSASLLNIQQVLAHQFPLLDLNKVDVLTLSNVTSFSGNDVDRIKSFVERGGGLVLFPGSEIQLTNYNSTLLPALNIPPVEELRGNANQQLGLAFQKIDLDHPLFTTVFEKEPSGKNDRSENTESPNIMRVLKRQTGKQGRSIISLSDGSAFLSEHRLRDGRILFYSVAPNLTWSDFPLKGLFAPLLYRSIIYVSTGEDRQSTGTTGDELIISLRGTSLRITDENQSSSGGNRYTVMAPDEVEELIQPAVQSASRGGFNNALAFSIKRLNLPGFYEIRNGQRSLSLIAANVDPLESDTRKLSETDQAKFWDRFGVHSRSIHSVKPGEQFQTSILQSRFGVELWKYCIVLALLMALMEMLIARDSRKALQQAAA